MNIHSLYPFFGYVIFSILKLSVVHCAPAVIEADHLMAIEQLVGSIYTIQGVVPRDVGQYNHLAEALNHAELARQELCKEMPQDGQGVDAGDKPVSLGNPDLYDKTPQKRTPRPIHAK